MDLKQNAPDLSRSGAFFIVTVRCWFLPVENDVKSVTSHIASRSRSLASDKRANAFAFSAFPPSAASRKNPASYCNGERDHDENRRDSECGPHSDGD